MHDLEPLRVPRLVPLLLCALAGAPAAAQVAQGSSPVSIGGGVAVPPGSYGGIFSRIVAGELTGDLSTDAVFLVGTTPLLLHTPEAYGTLLSVPVPAEDLAVEPGAGPGGRDALLIVNAAGLTRAWWTAEGFGTEPIVVDGWRGARVVRTGDLNGDGLGDVVGLAGNGTTVLAGYGRASGGFFGRVLFAAPDPVLALELLDWDGDGADEVALLTETEARVQTHLGALVASAATGSPGGVLAVLDDAGRAAQRLVVIAHVDAGADEWVWVMGETGTEVPARLGAIDAVGAATADLGGDGRADLLVSHRAGDWLGIVHAAESGPVTFPVAPEGLSDGIDIPWDGYDAALNEAVPCVADFDGDGDADVLHGLEGVYKVVLWDGRWVEHGEIQPPVAGGRLIVPWDDTLELAVSIGQPTVVPEGVNKLQVLAWKEASYGAGTVPGAILNVVHDLPAEWPLVVHVPLADEEDQEFETIYSILVRQVRVEGGEIVEQHAARTFSYAQGDSYALLSLTAGAGALYDVPVEVWDEEGEVYPDSIAGSGIIELPKIPEFPEEEAPEEGEPSGS